VLIRTGWLEAQKGVTQPDFNAEPGIEISAARRHDPRLLCTQCFSDAAVWHATTGRGTLHSWRVSHHAFHPSFKSELPYTQVTVDLEEGVRALGRWLGPAALSMGQPMQGQFEAQSAPSTGFDLVLGPPAG
jgi:uncharacterized protein